ncbi:flavodoxin family protein [Acetanaerobacterium elongatum]|uniref:Multimeric flavodoxin WrbA n=1 Tax=Acetanaerobacterium elongatum TaxID=258515 RepID=A0A1H0DGG7_9FIRM|nr:flavodoxin family protein [Acetanaerobacterium elongatum]SDN69245.1 Multimeric flavodoxin WrbA [Acetanaerobacterium elongatum]
MKVTAICGSAHKDGNTETIMKLVLRELQAQQIETELIPLCDLEIQPCRGCFACRGKGQCTAIRDDFGGCFERMVSAQGILLGSPVYSADISAKMKAFLERAGVVAACNPGLLKYKVCASVAAVRRGGGLTTVDTMNHFFLNKETVLVGSTYWNMVYGKESGEVLQDEEGIKNMKNLGENMAWVLKRLF